MTIFKCGYCGKTYEDEAEYVRCVNQCFEKRAKEKERVRAQELEEAKDRRRQGILDVLDELKQMIAAWEKDYDEISPVSIVTTPDLSKYLW